MNDTKLYEVVGGKPNLRVVAHNTLFEKVRFSGSTVKYIGRNVVQNANEASSTWQVSRVLISGNDTITEYADNGNYSQMFVNPESLFSEPPFVNVYSLDISAGNKRLDIADNPLLNFNKAQPFTWNVWFKLENTTTEILLNKNLSNRGYKLTKKSNESWEFEFRGEGGLGDRIRVTTPILVQTIDANWHMISITYAGTGSGLAEDIKIYFDGVEQTLTVNNQPLSGDPTNTGVLSIGSATGGGSYFEGFIDEVCLWNVALAQGNIISLYNLGNPTNPKVNSNGYDKASSLVSYWQFTQEDISTLPTIADQVGTNHANGVNIVGGNFVTEGAP